MNVTMKFEGGAELAAELNKLSARLSKKILRDALTDAAEPMRHRMEQLAPKGPDAPHIAENIRIGPATKIGSPGGEKWRSAEEGEVAIAVGPTRGYFYGLFWEYGWSKHPAAHPFMRPAFDGEVAKAVVEIGKRLWTALAARGIGRSVSAPTSVSSPGRTL